MSTAAPEVVVEQASILAFLVGGSESPSGATTVVGLRVVGEAIMRQARARRGKAIMRQAGDTSVRACLLHTRGKAMKAIAAYTAIAFAAIAFVAIAFAARICPFVQLSLYRAWSGV